MALPVVALGRATPAELIPDRFNSDFTGSLRGLPLRRILAAGGSYGAASRTRETVVTSMYVLHIHSLIVYTYAYSIGTSGTNVELPISSSGIG